MSPTATSPQPKSSPAPSPSSLDADELPNPPSTEELEAPELELRCVPRFGTRRRPDRPNLLPLARLIAWSIGVELMPWQEHVIAVGTEFNPATGRPCYRQVWITVPRQSGKTTVLLVVTLVRSIAFGPNQRMVYSAQTGSDARDKFIEDWVPVLKASPFVWGKPGRDHPNGHGLARRLQTQNGHEGLDFLNGSLFRLLSSTDSSGHGKTLHLGMFDEAWKDYDLRREAAVVPATNAVPTAQFWGVSTMGHGDSVFLNAKVAAGRKAVKADVGRGMAYFEWSALPGTEIFDTDAWWTFMPALGFTHEVEVIRDNIQIVVDDPNKGPDEARRAYLNIPTAGVRTVFPPGTWDQVTEEDVVPSGKLTLALEVHPDRKSAAIAAADDDHAIELIEHRTGPLDWVLDRTAEIALKSDAPVVIDKGGPAATFIEPLREKGVTVIEAGTREFTQACGSFYDAVIERTIQVRKHPGADAAEVALLTDDDAAMIARDEAAAEAIESARRRSVADAWAWARKVGEHDATPLTSMSLALWGTAHHPDEEEDSIGTFAEVI